MDEPRGTAPSSQADALPHLLSPRPAAFDDLTLGLLDDGRPGSQELLERLAERLAERHFLARVVRATTSPDADRTAPGATGLEAGCDVVAAGLGDAEASVERLVTEGVELERRRVPCAVLVLPGEVERARELADALGVPALAVVPVERLGHDSSLARGIVRSAVSSLERALCSDPVYGASSPASSRTTNAQGVSCEC